MYRVTNCVVFAFTLSRKVFVVVAIWRVKQQRYPRRVLHVAIPHFFLDAISTFAIGFYLISLHATHKLLRVQQRVPLNSSPWLPDATLAEFSRAALGGALPSLGHYNTVASSLQVPW